MEHTVRRPILPLHKDFCNCPSCGICFEDAIIDDKCSDEEYGDWLAGELALDALATAARALDEPIVTDKSQDFIATLLQSAQYEVNYATGEVRRIR